MAKEKSGGAAKTVRTMLKRAALVCLLGSLMLTIVGGLSLGYRHAQKTSGEGAVASPKAPAAYGDEASGQLSKFTVDLTYTSLDVPDNGEVTSQVAWNDAWFTADEATYNHDLAQTASVLAALAYSESGYYQAGTDQPAYMENALSKLGFSDISTASYQYRSEVVDEILNVVTDDADSIAYTVARRHLITDNGTKRDLIVVSARGSYGSEWLSNLNVAQCTSSDHSGYCRAAQEICEEIAAWTAESRASGAEVSLLLVGHSRGGAVANLAAADIADLRAGDSDHDLPPVLSEIDHAYAYTFASPATTVNTQAHDARYASIFNIVNPSDIMPFLPLQAWGYERYGVSLELPGTGDQEFEALYEKMRESYRQATGVECSYDPADKETVQAVLASLASGVTSIDELATPKGAASVFLAAAAHVNPVRILYSHYPTTYIAWLDVIEPEQLTYQVG